MKDKIVEDEKEESKHEKSRTIETLMVPSIAIDMKSEQSSSEEEVQGELKPRATIEARFTLNNKFSKRMLAFKKNCRDKMNVYQGEVARLRRRLGIITTKKMVYLCINQDRINMYNIPLSATPARQFLYDCETISSEIDEKDNTVLRLHVNKKEYVFKLSDAEQAKEWSDYINQAVKKKDSEIEANNRKTWRSPHVTMLRFTKEANTFDILKFQDHGEKTYGIVLQTIDKDAPKDLLYENPPEVLYYSHHLKKPTITTVDEIFSKKDVYIIPLINFE